MRTKVKGKKIINKNNKNGKITRKINKERLLSRSEMCIRYGREDKNRVHFAQDSYLSWFLDYPLRIPLKLQFPFLIFIC